MRKQLRRVLGLPKADRSFRHALIPVCWFVIVLLTAAHGASKTAAPNDKSPHPTAAQSTSAADPSASRRPADLLLSRYLRFSRFTAHDGLSSDQTRGVVQDKRGFMWFATIGGLNRYDGASVKVYRHDPDDSNSLSHSTARAVIVDQSGVLWIGTWGGGLNQYDSAKDAFIRYQHDPENPHSLNNDIVRTVYEDRAGTIWAGTMGGLNKLDRDSGQFTRYQHDPGDPNSLSHNLVWSDVEDRAGVFCIGTGVGRSRRRVLSV